MWLYLLAQAEDLIEDDSDGFTLHGNCISLMVIEDGALEGTEIFRLTIECATLNIDAEGNSEQLCIEANTLQFQIEDISE